MEYRKPAFQLAGEAGAAYSVTMQSNYNIFYSFGDYIASQYDADFYKFMPSKYLDAFLSGESVKVGSIHEYQGIDEHELAAEVFGDDRIAYSFKDQSDPGKQKSGPASLIGRGGIEDPFEGRSVMWQGKNFRRGGTVYRNTLAVKETPNHYIFSGAWRADPKTAQRIILDSKRLSPDRSDVYDVCVPIISPRRFMKALASAMSELLPNEQVWVTRGNVQYCRMVGDMENYPQYPNPFRKHVSFEDQSETRILFGSPITKRTKGAIISAQFEPWWFGEPIFFDENGDERRSLRRSAA